MDNKSYSNRKPLIKGGVALAVMVGIGWLLVGNKDPAKASDGIHLPSTGAESSAGLSAAPIASIPSVAAGAASSLSGSSENGDLYEREARCIGALRIKSRIDGEMNVCKESSHLRGDPANQEFFASCAKREAAYAKALATAERELRGCPLPSREEAEQAYYQTTVSAAKAGNRDARLCYVATRFHLGRPWTPDEQTLYKSLAPSYIDEAIKRGDWRIAELYRTSDQRMVGTYTLLHLVAPYDVAYQYKMNRLMMLGTTDPTFRRILEVSAKPPTDASIKAESERWAQETFERNFKSSPPLKGPPEVCAEDSVAAMTS